MLFNSGHLKLILSISLIPILLIFHSSTFANNQTEISAGEKAIQKANEIIININTEELQKLLKRNPKLELIDVRTTDEVNFIGGTIDADENAIIPRGWLEFTISDEVRTKNTPIVVYCGTNQRSPLATQTLMSMGYTNVKNYADGFNKWKKLGLPIQASDKAPEQMLFSKPIKIIENVWSAIGATDRPTYANSGHNNNLSFIITNNGVLVFNAGDNYLLAKSLHYEIKKLTDQPIKYVVLENAQGHAMLGSNYWKEQGAEIIAHVDALTVMKAHHEKILDRMTRGRRDKAEGTVFVYPDKTFEEKMTIEMGDETFELLHLGPAHSPGDIMLWMPKKKLVISGDMAFNQRLLPITDHTDTAGWIKTWDKFEDLKPKIIIPGHGDPTTMTVVKKTTKDYLVYMRAKIGEILDNDGTEQEAYKIDQSAFSHLDTFKLLALQNAGRIYRMMEFE